MDIEDYGNHRVRFIDGHAYESQYQKRLYTPNDNICEIVFETISNDDAIKIDEYFRKSIKSSSAPVGAIYCVESTGLYTVLLIGSDENKGISVGGIGNDHISAYEQAEGLYRFLALHHPIETIVREIIEFSPFENILIVSFVKNAGAPLDMLMEGQIFSFRWEIPRSFPALLYAFRYKTIIITDESANRILGYWGTDNYGRYLTYKNMVLNEKVGDILPLKILSKS